MLPEGWKECFLGELVDGTIKNGFSANPVEKISGMYILSLGCLTEDGLIVDQIKNIDKNMSLYEYILQPGDILVSRSNTPDKVGRSAMFRGEIKNCIYPDLMMRFRVKKTVSANFIESVLKHFRARQYLKKSASGSSLSMVKITKATLEKLPVSLPPLPEQEKIAAILSTWDKAISTTDALLENSRQQKKALMQQLLTGKRRLPGFKGEWKNFRLIQRAAIAKGTQINKATLSSSGDYPVMNGGILPSGYFDSFNSPANSIIISEGGNSCGFVQYIKTCFWCGGHCYKLEIKYDYDRYIYHYLKFFEKKIMALRVGSGLPNIQKERLANFGIKVPPLDEQHAIATVLDAADREITLLEQKTARLRKEKKALMQQLLTGKRRVQV